eukprot:gnl/MRDRNA2_/MRDRNA2_252893_c0_seq1.p1 gnl/MRDRNA2_/MRDRNA2_252893_c0~~gnl/MRDRNA2_/MRDRNA2_252893_c0_seq1.p1  ORF type:complete len:252 (+),score=25.02 gnl/MRDRNA2_/MRDRNA2_252893_c0_seq1:74-829(+)
MASPAPSSRASTASRVSKASHLSKCSSSQSYFIAHGMDNNFRKERAGIVGLPQQIAPPRPINQNVLAALGREVIEATAAVQNAGHGKIGAPRPPGTQLRDSTLYWDSPLLHGRRRADGGNPQLTELATISNVGQQLPPGAKRNEPAVFTAIQRRGCLRTHARSEGILPEARASDGRWHARAHQNTRGRRNIQVALLEGHPAIRLFPRIRCPAPFDTRSQEATPRAELKATRLRSHAAGQKVVSAPLLLSHV